MDHSDPSKKNPHAVKKDGNSPYTLGEIANEGGIGILFPVLLRGRGEINATLLAKKARDKWPSVVEVLWSSIFIWKGPCDKTCACETGLKIDGKLLRRETSDRSSLKKKLRRGRGVFKCGG